MGKSGIHPIHPVLICFLMIFLMGEHAHGANDSLRCSNTLISLGDTMYQVRYSCGEPEMAHIVGEKIVHRAMRNGKFRVESSMYITEWIYEHSDGIYILTFEGSKLKKKEFIFQ